MAIRRLNPRIGAIIAVATVGLGCSGTLPVQQYTPTTLVRTNGQFAIGDFTYLPLKEGKVKSNQIQNTAVGSIYVPDDVAEMVRTATALELERAGIKLMASDAPLLEGEVVELKAGDWGYAIQWNYTIRYRITSRQTGEVYEPTYSVGPRKTGKFGHAADYGSLVNELIRDGVNQLLDDQKAISLLTAN
jgi:hypothetical protein